VDAAENDALTQDAAKLIQLRRAATDPPNLSQPDTWRDIGIELGFEQDAIRLRPEGDSATNVEVLDREHLSVGSETAHDYRSADELADRIEAIYERLRSSP
jgi:hypothetical protein